ncbi:MAG TPA: response regulator transcription factor, partial [Thermomicrobiaceae bacterium]|nr:response regulator transcription factor [Thermomicrobiaceae bacterium]
MQDCAETANHQQVEPDDPRGEGAVDERAADGQVDVPRGTGSGRRNARPRSSAPGRRLARVLIADDHPLYRSGLRGLLAAVSETEVTGEDSTGEETVALAAQLRPDVIIMDLQMPGINGIEATRRIVETHPHVGVLMVTMFEDDRSVFAAMRAAARGYVLKDSDEEEMLRAIRAVGNGEAIFSPVIAQRVLTFFGDARQAAAERDFPELTEREREVLGLIAQGRSNPQIAARLGLSPKTVRNHISNI